eukprot:TRINITY_DN19781_c0_g1_i1.p1 TRINITY_DN19781_c0_g1~~TRINITY_DN19781_c0_g1_i1.p1  ORF type:complete len:852 (+),score=162.13 TRINITY_DN19781_c0_g1_i1:23-2557(+)
MTQNFSAIFSEDIVQNSTVDSTLIPGNTGQPKLVSPLALDSHANGDMESSRSRPSGSTSSTDHHSLAKSRLPPLMRRDGIVSKVSTSSQNEIGAARNESFRIKPVRNPLERQTIHGSTDHTGSTQIEVKVESQHEPENANEHSTPNTPTSRSSSRPLFYALDQFGYATRRSTSTSRRSSSVVASSHPDVAVLNPSVSGAQFVPESGLLRALATPARLHDPQSEIQEVGELLRELRKKMADAQDPLLIPHEKHGATEDGLEDEGAMYDSRIYMALNSRVYAVVMFISTLISVVSDDFRILLLPKVLDVPLLWIFASITVLFAIDLVLSVLVYRSSYWRTVFFPLDVLSLTTMVTELVVFFAPHSTSVGWTLRTASRAGQVAKVVAQSGKLIRCVKLFVELAKERRVIEDMDVDIYTLSQVSRVGQKLRALTIRNVVFGVFITFEIPILLGLLTVENPQLSYNLVGQLLQVLESGSPELLHSVNAVHNFFGDRLVFIHVNGTTLWETSAYVALRSRELDCGGNTVARVCVNNHARLALGAGADLIQLVVLLCLLTLGNHQFMKHCIRLFIQPVERMLAILAQVRKNPLVGLDAALDESGDETSVLVQTLYALLKELQNRALVLVEHFVLLRTSERLRISAEAEATSKTNFLMSMSHELRTPISGVMGHAELLQQTKLDQNQAELLQAIVTCGHTLLHQVNEVLDYGKLQNGKLQLERCPFNLRLLLDEIFTIVPFEANGKQINPTLHIDPDLAVTYFGDAHRLRQVLVNLVGNAVKFTPTNGEVAVFVRLAKAEEVPEKTAEALQEEFKAKSLVPPTVTAEMERLESMLLSGNPEDIQLFEDSRNR